MRILIPALVALVALVGCGDPEPLGVTSPPLAPEAESSALDVLQQVIDGDGERPVFLAVLSPT